jgi:predicted nucleic acid-binding protein
MIVIADTAPLNYLALIDEIHILPLMYGKVIIPDAVFLELQSAGTPQEIRNWLESSPSWLEVKTVSSPPDMSLGKLDAGEREAIQLAEELSPSTIIIDDKEGRKAAEARNIKVIGTLGVLGDAAASGLVDLPKALEQLNETNFRLTSQLMQTILERDAERKSAGQTQTISEQTQQEQEPDNT